MESPVPASMFAPEPSSPGAARAAAAAARLHGGFDSDCSEDGEALNGEPELDLTSKVGPGRRRLRGRGTEGEPGGGPSRLWGDGGGGRGRALPPVSAGRAAGSRARGGSGCPRAPPSVSGGAHPASQPSGSRRDHNPSAPPRGTRAPDAGSCPRSDGPHAMPPPREIERDSLRGLPTAAVGQRWLGQGERGRIR